MAMFRDATVGGLEAVQTASSMVAFQSMTTLSFLAGRVWPAATVDAICWAMGVWLATDNKQRSSSASSLSAKRRCGRRFGVRRDRQERNRDMGANLRAMDHGKSSRRPG